MIPLITIPYAKFYDWNTMPLCPFMPRKSEYKNWKQVYIQYLWSKRRRARLSYTKVMGASRTFVDYDCIKSIHFVVLINWDENFDEP